MTMLFGAPRVARTKAIRVSRGDVVRFLEPRIDGQESWVVGAVDAIFTPRYGEVRMRVRGQTFSVRSDYEVEVL